MQHRDQHACLLAGLLNVVRFALHVNFTLSQDKTLASTLESIGADVTLRAWDELRHVFEFYDELPEADRSLRRRLDGG